MQTTQKVALITSVTGQDGSYLAELLLEKGYISPRHQVPALRRSLPIATQEQALAHATVVAGVGVVAA